jgi:hypothetical protein
MKNTLLKTTGTPRLKAIPKAGPVLPYTGMYIKVNNWKKNEKPSPFKAQYQTGSLAKESTNWDADWFGHYE